MRVGEFNTFFMLARIDTCLPCRRGETCSHLQICALVSLMTVRGRNTEWFNLRDSPSLAAENCQSQQLLVVLDDELLLSSRQ